VVLIAHIVPQLKYTNWIYR